MGKSINLKAKIIKIEKITYYIKKNKKKKRIDVVNFVLIKKYGNEFKKIYAYINIENQDMNNYLMTFKINDYINLFGNFVFKFNKKKVYKSYKNFKIRSLNKIKSKGVKNIIGTNKRKRI